MKPRISAVSLSSSGCAVRLYVKNKPAYPYDRFVASIVHTRNSAVDALRAENIDGNNKTEIVVILR